MKKTRITPIDKLVQMMTTKTFEEAPERIKRSPADINHPLYLIAGYMYVEERAWKKVAQYVERGEHTSALRKWMVGALCAFLMIYVVLFGGRFGLYVFMGVDLFPAVILLSLASCFMVLRERLRFERETAFYVYVMFAYLDKPEEVQEEIYLEYKELLSSANI